MARFFVAVADSVFPNLDPATAVLSEIGAELELAADSSPESVMKLAAGRGIETPIAREVDAVLNHGQPVEETYRGLLRVTPGHEVHGEAW